MRWLLLALVLVLSPARADEALWSALREGGHVLFVRHAQTDPGVGDPPGFRLEECATQRNLSAEGRAQARGLGEVIGESALMKQLLQTVNRVAASDATVLIVGESGTQVALVGADGKAHLRTIRIGQDHGNTVEVSSGVTPRDRVIDRVGSGDLGVFRTAGAYGATMASTYNSRSLVPEVLVDGDRYIVVADRIAAGTIMAAERVPDWID